MAFFGIQILPNLISADPAGGVYDAVSDPLVAKGG